MENEIWKVVPEDERYSVSNMGRIKGPRGISLGTKTSKGYRSLYVNGKGYRVHRLVMRLFVCDSYLHVNHKNGIKDDNRIENLEYCTQAENNIHAIMTGLNPPVTGSRNGASKLTETQVQEILKVKLSNCSLARLCGVSEGTIRFIKNHTYWKSAYEENLK